MYLLINPESVRASTERVFSDSKGWLNLIFVIIIINLPKWEMSKADGIGRNGAT